MEYMLTVYYQNYLNFTSIQKTNTKEYIKSLANQYGYKFLLLNDYKDLVVYFSPLEKSRATPDSLQQLKNKLFSPKKIDRKINFPRNN